MAARHVALLIHNTMVCAPDDLRETLRKMTRMQLIRTLAAWRLDPPFMAHRVIPLLGRMPERVIMTSRPPGIRGMRFK